MMDGRVEGEDKDGQELSRGGAKGGGRLSKIALHAVSFFDFRSLFARPTRIGILCGTSQNTRNTTGVVIGWWKRRLVSSGMQ